MRRRRATRTTMILLLVGISLIGDAVIKLVVMQNQDMWMRMMRIMLET